jgi:2-methylcitrate dehydratase PrpD
MTRCLPRTGLRRQSAVDYLSVIPAPGFAPWPRLGHTVALPAEDIGMGVTEKLSAFTAAITLDSVPPEVVHRARFLVLDLVGNIVRARHDAESTAAFLATARALGMAAGNSGVFGDAARYTPAGAALLNGALAHSLDFDDTHAAGSLHPGAPVIPAALAAGEMVGASGADVLAAIIAG